MQIGIDIVDVADFKRSINRTKSLKYKLFTSHEIDYCRKKGLEHLASRFAAKEAFFKACNAGGISWKDVEIRNIESGKPEIVLGKKAKSRFNFSLIEVSLSQTGKNAVAVVLVDYSKK